MRPYPFRLKCQPDIQTARARARACARARARARARAAAAAAATVRSIFGASAIALGDFPWSDLTVWGARARQRAGTCCSSTGNI